MKELTVNPQKQDLKNKILILKKELNAVILAHYYQSPDIQDIADYVGDSLALSQIAATTTAETIVFAGVHFMAETAKILNPGKKVLLPDLDAGCSLSDACSAESFKSFREKHPKHIAVTYINCSAGVKALSDIICTSSNALKIINSIPDETPILFAPDKNLGHYLQTKTGRDMLLWDGACSVHEAFSKDKINDLKKRYTNARIVAHPESEAPILEMADFIGSTSAMLKYVCTNESKIYIVATEAGILHQMKRSVPNKTLIPAPSNENNTCACSECPYMKMNTLEKLYNAMRFQSPEILLDEGIRRMALIPIERMMQLS